MSAFTVKSEDTQFLMIDIQEKLLPAIHENERIQGNIIKLLKTAQVLGIPVKFTEQYPKGLGPTVPPVKEALEGKGQHLEKSHFSCMDEKGFESFIHDPVRNKVVVFGIESHICVLSTVMGMLEKGIKVTVVHDACGSRNPRNHEIAMNALGHAGALVLPVESVIYQLICQSGTPEFKSLLPLFK